MDVLCQCGGEIEALKRGDNCTMEPAHDRNSCQLQRSNWSRPGIKYLRGTGGHVSNGTMDLVMACS
jgi:hypothetical protein